MPNEFIFLAHTIFVSISTLAALRLGKSALVAFIAIQCILANLFVLKQTTLFGLSATCSDAFTIGATLGLNLLQEYYGKSIARTSIYVNFFLLIFYAIISQIHLAYTPNAFDATHNLFEPLLSPMPRIVIASFIVFFIAQNVDYWLYGLLRRVWTQRFLVIRNYASICVSQLVDTILFSFLGLYGLVENIGHIILISYSVKLIAILIGTPFVALSARIVKKDTSS